MLPVANKTDNADSPDNSPYQNISLRTPSKDFLQVFSSAADQLSPGVNDPLLGGGTIEDKFFGSRRSSVDPSAVKSGKRTSLNVTNLSKESSVQRRSSRFAAENEVHLRPDSGNNRRSTLKKKEMKPRPSFRYSKVKLPARFNRAPSFKDVESINSSQSDLYDLHDLYRLPDVDANSGVPKKPDELSSMDSPVSRISIFSPASDASPVRGLRAKSTKSKIGDLYYKAMRRKLARRRSEIFEEPLDFEYQVETIRDNIRPPNQEKLRDLQISNKTNLERLNDYKDTLPLLKSRKNIAKVFRYFSIFCARTIVNPIFEYFILVVVIANSIILASDDPTDDVSNVPAAVDNFFLGTYTAEAFIKICGMGFILNEKSYMRDPWNIMDFTIVVTAYVPIILASDHLNLQGIRALRVLRPLRTISNIEALRVIVTTLLSAFKPLMETLFILFFLFLIFSIAGLQLFQGVLKRRCFSLEQGIVMSANEQDNFSQQYCTDDTDCGWNYSTGTPIYTICGKMLQNPSYGITNFDTILSALLMVFQVVTLEGWSQTMYDLDKTFHPASAIFFIALVVIGAFFLLNLTLAVVKAEFSSQARDASDPGHIKKELTYREKLQEKIAHNKADIIKLVNKRRNEEILFNKYEIKKDCLVALDKDRMRRYRTEVRRRRMKNTFASKVFDKLVTMKRAMGRMLPFRAASKGIKSLSSMLQRNRTDGTQPDSARQTPEKKTLIKGTSDFTKKNSDETTMSNTSKNQIVFKIDSPLTPADPRSASSENAESNKRSRFMNVIMQAMERNGSKSPDEKTPLTTIMKREHTSPSDLNSKRSDDVLIGQRTEGADDISGTSPGPKELRKMYSSKSPSIAVDMKAPTLLGIPSIAEANERSEQSIGPGSYSSSRISMPRKTSFKTKGFGLKFGVPVKPVITNKVVLAMRNRKQVEELDNSEEHETSRERQKEKSKNVALINIAGIRNKEAEKQAENSKRKKIIERMETDDINEAIFGDEDSALDWADNIREEEKLRLEKAQRRRDTVTKEQLLRKINRVFKLNYRMGPSQNRRPSNLPMSMLSFDNELQDLKNVEAGVPTNILDDSDFFDNRQRYEIMRRKKLSNKYAKKKTVTMSRNYTLKTLAEVDGAGSSRLGSRAYLKDRRPLLASMNSMNLDSNKMQYEQEDDDKYIIDVRHLKPNPISTHVFESLSSEDVLPERKAAELRRIEQEEVAVLRRTRMRLSFKVTRADEEKAKERWSTYYKTVAKLPSMAVEKSYGTMRIRRRLQEEEVLEAQLSRGFTRESNQNGGHTMTRNLTKHMGGKRRIFNNTAGRNRQTPQEDDDVLPPEKMDDFFEVLKAVNKPFKNWVLYETELANPEEEEHKDFKNHTDYKSIRKKDLEQNTINDKNWSGDNVLSFTNNTFPVDTAKRTLNVYDYDYWRPGVYGVWHAFRRIMRRLVESSIFNAFIMLSVFLNTLILASQGLITDQPTLDLLNDFNLVFTIIFTIEMGFKLIAMNPIGYVRDRMNIFDAIIVIVSLVETIFLSGSSKRKAVSAFRAIRLFRTFRVLRVTKLLRSLTYMKVIIGVISRSLNKFAWIAVLLFLFVFIYALLGMQIFGGQFDYSDNTGPNRLRENFDTFADAFITSFQIMTQENWNDLLVLTLRNPNLSKVVSLIYLISWIFIGNYILLNLFLAILLDEFCGDEVEEELEELDEETEEELSYGSRTRSMNQTLERGTTKKSSLKIHTKDGDSLKHSGSKVSEDISEDEGGLSNRHLQKTGIIPCKKTFYIISQENIFRLVCIRLVRHNWFERAILTLIVLNSIKLALDTYTDVGSDLYSVSQTLDIVFNSCFAFEAFVKIISYGFFIDKRSYLRDTWNILDFIIVVASILDMSSESINLGFIKILRLLRTLRPLRFISHNESMRMIVTALLESTNAIVNVLIVVLLIWLMFAILAVNIVGGDLGYCNLADQSASIYYISYSNCTSNYTDGNWVIPSVNYDNVINAMLSLFVLSTQENWPGQMYAVVDSNDPSEGPILNHNRAFGYVYFIVFLFVGSYFLINLFIGVILLEFTRIRKKESGIHRFLTPEQQKWVVMQSLVPSITANTANVEPKHKFMKFFFKFINHAYFEVFIMLVIVCNILTMALSMENSSDYYNSVLQILNWTFSGIFMLELILKHLGLGFRRYWASGWNKFDAFVVAASIVDIVMNSLQQSFASFVRVGPQLARIFRVLRVSRLFKLIKSLKGLQKLINTLVFSLPSLLNVGALLFLVFFIYAVLGVFLFKGVQSGQIIDQAFINFTNFHTAIITLFRCSTGENWYYIMFDTVNPSQCYPGYSSCGAYSYGIPFWISFIMICVYIFLNLFILVILEQFEEYQLNPDNPINNFRENLENIFKPHWEKYALKYGCTNIHISQLLDFFMTLPGPLGYKNCLLPKRQIAKEVMQMNIIPDHNGMLFYNDVVFAAFKNGFNREGASQFIQFHFLEREEQKTRDKLDNMKKRALMLYKRAKTVGRGTTKQKTVAANPITRMLFMGMTIKAWIQYAHLIGEKMKACEANDIDYVSSGSDEDRYLKEGERDDSDYEEEEEEMEEEEEENEESVEQRTNGEAEIEKNVQILPQEFSKHALNIEINNFIHSNNNISVTPTASHKNLKSEFDSDPEDEQNQEHYDKMNNEAEPSPFSQVGIQRKNRVPIILSRQPSNRTVSQDLEGRNGTPSRNTPLRIIQHAPDDEATGKSAAKLLYSFYDLEGSPKKIDSKGVSKVQVDGESKPNIINYNINNNIIINNNYYIHPQSFDFSSGYPLPVTVMNKEGNSGTGTKNSLSVDSKSKIKPRSKSDLTDKET